MKYKNILLMMLCVLLFAACAIIDEPSETTRWRKTRPNMSVPPLLSQSID